jgi:hypothetical protein
MAWYVSLTLRWADQKGASLASFLDYCSKVQIPNDRIRVPQSCWHSTLYAFAKIERIFYPHANMHDSALFVLTKLRKTTIVEALSKLPQFRFHPVALKHLVRNTTIEFEAENGIAALRESLSNAVESISLRFEAHDVSFPFDGGPKNSGNKLWGSIARNPVSGSSNPLQQSLRIPEKCTSLFTAQEAIFTISDESLGNTLDDGDFGTIRLT